MAVRDMLMAAAGGTSAAATYVDDVFSTYLYANGTQAINNGIDLSTKGGMVWLKNRTSATNNKLIDTVRGPAWTLISNKSDADLKNDDLSSFNTNGFSVNASTSGNYVSWTFRKQPKFFDVVTYTGNGSTKTITHNLGSVPGCIIVKRTDSADEWGVYHRSVGNTKALLLNTTDTPYTAAYWNNTTPTSTEFYVGGTSLTNANGGTYVAYLFAHDAGGFGAAGTDNVISCGSWTGDGSASNTVTLGYEPQYILWKNASNGIRNWFVTDMMRGLSYTATAFLNPNTTAAENNENLYFEPTATGFKIVNSSDNVNQNGSAFVYIAIRRPHKPPTTGTEVFTPVLAQSATPGFPAGIVTDAYFMTYKFGDGTYQRSSARLLGANNLQTSATNAENADAEVKWDYMNGAYTGGALSSDFAAHCFRRAPGFFDVVCYSGTGSARTVTHNLGVAPELMIVKNRSDAQGWRIYHTGLGGNNAYQTFGNSDTSTSSVIWNNTAPTSSVFSVGNTIAVNNSGYNYVAYLFATLPGISKVGSYTGNGTTNSINCGFTSGARFVLIKSTANFTDWYLWDTARGIVSGNDTYTKLNSTDGWVTNTDYIDPYSAGFEISSSAPAAINANGGTFIYLAIA